jgi:hypothetical protein
MNANPTSRPRSRKRANSGYIYCLGVGVYLAKHDVRALICLECGACKDWTTYTEENLPIYLILYRLMLKIRRKQMAGLSTFFGNLGYAEPLR